MKILHLVHCYPPAIGGAEFMVRSISERLVKNYNDDVTVITSNAYNCEAFFSPEMQVMPPITEIINGVKIIRCPFNPIITKFLRKHINIFKNIPIYDLFRFIANGPLSFNMLYKTINFEEIDVIMATTFPVLQMLYSYISGKLNQKPVVLSGCFHINDPNFDNSIFYKMCQTADAYITNSEDEKEFLIKKGVNEDKLNLIYCGVDIDMFKIYNTEKFKQRYDVPLNAQIVLYVGQKICYKGIDKLIESMKIVWQKKENVYLFLCGGAYSNYMIELRQIINSLDENIQKKIINIDNFSDDEKSDIFNACDVFVLPSNTESFGMTFLEAWSCKKPVIGCRTTGVKKVIDDGVNGLLFENNNISELSEKILYLLNDKETANLFGINGYNKTLKNYSFDKITADFRNLYLSLIKKNNIKFKRN